MLIRGEEPKDQVGVHAVNASAFETPAEANLVDMLRKEAHPVISLVAEDNATIVGHIMFSPVSLAGRADLKIMGLGPMVVALEHQRKGIGSALVKAGVEKCKELGLWCCNRTGALRILPPFWVLTFCVLWHQL